MTIKPSSIPVFTLSTLKASSVRSPYDPGPHNVYVQHEGHTFIVSKGAVASRGFYYTVESKLWPGYRVVDSIAKVKNLIREEAVKKLTCFGGPLHGKEGPAFGGFDSFCHHEGFGKSHKYNLRQYVEKHFNGSIAARWVWVLDEHPINDLMTFHVD